MDVAEVDFADKEFVFGRLIRRSNLELQTLGKVRLCKDGAVRGYRHPNEAVWRIRQGKLSVASESQETTRFDQVVELASIRMFVGRCLVAGHTHFLYPYEPLRTSRFRILYVISSHASYGKALECLLPQLLQAGVPTGDLWVTVAGASRSELQNRNGVTFSHVLENAFEYTGLLDIARREISHDSIFLLHDTCFVGPNFRELVEDQPSTLSIDYISVLSTGWFNIGLYSRKFLIANRAFLQGLDGLAKRKAVEMELDIGGIGFKRRAPITSNFLNGIGVLQGIHKPYGSLLRKKMYLPGADLHKFYGINHAVFTP